MIKLPKILPLLGLDGITLKHGAHNSRDQGVCALEAAAWLAGEKHSDHPECVCPVIGNFMRRWNDDLPSDEDRNRLLKPLLPLIIGSRAGKKTEAKRSQLAYDWYLRVYTPACLDAAKLHKYAKSLRENPSFANLTAARAAARAAARDAAGAAAWAAARDAARDAARAAARAAAGDAAGAAAGDALDAAWAAAWAAAGDALNDTKLQLQNSAVDLVKRMVAVGKIKAAQ